MRGDVRPAFEPLVALPTIRRACSQVIQTPIAPLQGRTIIEFACAGGSEVTGRAVALAGRIAADFGATIIKVEPPGGDALRHAGPFIQGKDGRAESATFAFLNGGKRSLALSGGAKDEALLSALAGKAIAVLTDDRDALPAHFAAVPVKVLVEHGVPASLGVPDARVADTYDPRAQRVARPDRRIPMRRRCHWVGIRRAMWQGWRRSPG